MKTKIIYLSLILFFGFISCEKQDSMNPEKEELEKFTKGKSLVKANSTTQDLVEVYKKYEELMFRKQASFDVASNSKKAADLKKSGVNDSTASPETCANYTSYTDENGKFVEVFDYGTDGCEEGGAMISGKKTIKRESPNVFSYSKVFLENYSVNGIVENGSFSQMPGNDGSEIWITDIVYTLKSGEEFTVKAHYEEKRVGNTNVVVKGEEIISSSSGYSFSKEVIVPTVQDYDCNTAIPIVGSVKYSYDDAGQTGEVLFDYGDGECNSIFTLSQGDIIEEYTYGDEWLMKLCE